MKIHEQDEAVRVAIITAARDITVAKIQAKGARFNDYIRHKNWFDESLVEVMDALTDAEKQR